MEEKDLVFLKQFNDGKKIFFKVLRRAKNDIVLEEEDDFIEILIEDLTENDGLSGHDAERYARMIYEIWEECGCSLTTFDRQMNTYKKQLFS
jgi:hypothetical protein